MPRFTLDIAAYARFCSMFLSTSLLFTSWMTTAAMNDQTQTSQPDPPTDPLSAISVPVMPDIEIRANPMARREYAMVITFAGIPGPISDVTASADYAVDNVECVPPLELSGARLRPEHSLDLPLQSIDANRYGLTLHADALRDEDYFGMGVCHWSLQWATVRFRSAKTEFVGAIAIDRIEAGTPVVLHYLVSDYERAPEPSSVIFGEETDLYTAEAGPRFTITLIPSEASK
jgi:hypothetical protein